MSEAKPDLQGKPTGRKKAGKPAAAAAPATDLHRMLPQSTEAEKGVLCSILLSPRESLNECVDQISERSFYLPSHGTIFRVLGEMWAASQEIDLITLTQRLRDLGLLDAVGGAGALAEISSYIPTSANLAYYVEILREKEVLRRTIEVCTRSAARCYEEQGEVTVLLDDVEREILAIGEERIRGAVTTLEHEVLLAIENIEKMHKQGGRISGLPTGYSLLDQMTDGLHAGEMVVIAARPSMGKTALAMNIVEHVALDCEDPKAVGVFSLEMSTQQLVQRLLCSRARVNMKNIRSGLLARQDNLKLTEAAAALTKSRIFIDDSPGLTILDLRARARRMRERNQIELLAIDYLQLLRSPSKRGQENRQTEIAEISMGVKGLAKELGIPVVVLAQLNRQPEGRDGGRPRISDLRESGAIEQDADLVTLLVRPEVYEQDEEARRELEGQAELIIAKQRNGPIGTVPLTFLKEYTRFENRAMVTRDEGD